MPSIISIDSNIVRVKFCAEELWVLKKLAEARYLPKREAGIPKNFSPPQGGIESDFLGLKGEYAVASFFGVPFDTSISLSGDGGSFDLVLGKKSVQVKTTFYKTGRLVFNYEEDFTADVAILVVGEKDETFVDILGWAEREYFLSTCYHQNLGYGDRALLDQTALKNIHALRDGREIERLEALIEALKRERPLG